MYRKGKSHLWKAKVRGRYFLSITKTYYKAIVVKMIPALEQGQANRFLEQNTELGDKGTHVEKYNSQLSCTTNLGKAGLFKKPQSLSIDDWLVNR